MIASAAAATLTVDASSAQNAARRLFLGRGAGMLSSSAAVPSALSSPHASRLAALQAVRSITLSPPRARPDCRTTAVWQISPADPPNPAAMAPPLHVVKVLYAVFIAKASSFGTAPS